jgi:hypothetical protein
LSDERGYQVLDYVEFLESKFADRANPAGNAFTRFTEAVEDKLRAGRVSAGAIAETMSLLSRAGNVLSGAMAAGRSVAEDIVSVAQSATPRSTPGPSPAAPATAATKSPAPATPPPSPPAGEAK